jgi:uncharacterized membrane protein
MIRRPYVSLTAKLKNISRTQLAAIAFYTAAGILLMAALPLTGFPPHIGFLGIVNLITAYSLFTKRAWAPWLVFILLIANTVFSLYTLYYVGFSNMLVAISMLVYAVLTWAVTALLLIKRKA